MCWDKKDISFQCQLVQFRNGEIAIAISDKINKEDHDGDEVFMLYDVEQKIFNHSKRLCCYSEDLKCELSISGIMNRLNDVMDGSNNKSELSDTEWDVMKQNRYAYALDAFTALTSGKITWMWKRKE